MKLTRSLLCLPVLAAMALSSCTNSAGGGGVPSIAIGNSPIHAHRFGLADPSGLGAFGGYGGGYGNGYAMYPMPTENYGDYFDPEDDDSLVGNNWGRYNTVLTPYQAPMPAPAPAPSGYTASK